MEASDLTLVRKKRSLSHRNGCIALIRIRYARFGLVASLPFYLIRYFAPAINPRRRQYFFAPKLWFYRVSRRHEEWNSAKKVVSTYLSLPLSTLLNRDGRDLPNVFKTGTASYIADNIMFLVRVLRYFVQYSINQITWRSNDLCLSILLATCCCKLRRLGKQMAWPRGRPIQIAHIPYARENRVMTRILMPAFINANGNDLKWSRSRFKSRCQCQVHCKWYNLSLLFHYLSEFGSQPGEWSAFIVKRPGEMKYEVSHKYRGYENCFCIITHTTWDLLKINKEKQEGRTKEAIFKASLDA